MLSTTCGASIFIPAPASDAAPTRFFTNRVEDVGVQFPKHAGCLTCGLNAEAGRAAKIAGSDPQEVYAKLALESMQQYCHSDIALLQRRDVFAGFEETVQLWPTGFHYTPQQLVEEVLWKGDFTLCAPVQGSILRKVLTESAAFDRQDRDLFAVDVERGRGLHTLGIQKDASTGGPLIRGLPIEDDVIYAVALPSELGFGNAGYPEFPKAAMPPGVQLSWLTPATAERIACAKLGTAQARFLPSRTIRQNRPLQGSSARARGKRPKAAWMAAAMERFLQWVWPLGVSASAEARIRRTRKWRAGACGGSAYRTFRLDML